jgi:segregation and condensation protein A
MSDYRVNLDIFAGPLDLLLYLVRKDEVDIYDISIFKITEEYIKYIDILQGLDIDLAGDFLVMAATLMEIKSAMLLPKAEIGEDGTEQDSGDPRNELIRQLLEYKKFKDAANLLDESAIERSLRFGRPDVIIEKLEPDAEPQVEIEEISIWDLLAAFDSVLKATGNYQDYSKISDDTPIDLYQIEILHRLQVEGAMTFETIFKGKQNKLVMVGLFLGVLELIREKLIWVEQEGPYEQIYIKAMTNEPAEEAVRRAMMLSDAHDENLPMESQVSNIAPHKPPIPIQELPAEKNFAEEEFEIIENIEEHQPPE